MQLNRPSHTNTMTSRTSHTFEDPDTQKQIAAEAAVAYVHDGDVIGLGTGSTVKHFLSALKEKVKAGWRIQGVSTSQATSNLAQQFGIPLLTEEKDWVINVAIDGTDQVDPRFNLIKGGGGALIREKIVASAGRQLIVIADASKHVPVLGHPMPLPVEVIPFGWPHTAKLIQQLGYRSVLRQRDGRAFLTDSGHYILDVAIDRIDDPALLETTLNTIPGVVDNGLFVGRTSLLILGTPHGVEISSPTTRPSSV